jgi:hypothetical protein
MLKIVQLLLPALIPSWRFFDAIAPSPRIEFAQLENAQDGAERWQEFRPRPAHLPVSHMLARLLWNPRWNETLFLVSCAERLVENPAEHHAREIISRIQADLDQEGGNAAAYLQFRLVFVSRKGKQLQKRVRFTSPVYAYRQSPVS